ncbi:hypothetical protein MK489_09630 [Myxococcota bacterium]|nr:hypothetical protein [Myxococcota bacterium]
MTVRVHNPAGEVEVSGVVRAMGPPRLTGKRIAILDNGKPNADLLMSRIVQGLTERFGGRGVGTWQKQTAATPCEADVLDALVAGADLVVTGSAD